MKKETPAQNEKLENMFYVTGQNSESLLPLYPGERYTEDLELVTRFIAREKIHRLRYEKGTLFRSAIKDYTI